MAVTTSSKKPRQAQSKAKSLSDLQQLLKRTQPLNEKESTMNTATHQAAYSTTETTAKESTVNAFASANQEAKVDPTTPSGHEAPGSSAGQSDQEAKMAAFFKSLVDEMAQQTKASVDEIAENMRAGLEPLTKQIADNITETGEIKQKLTSVEAEMEKLKKDLAAAAKPAEKKEESTFTKVTSVIKDIGAYSGAALLLGIGGKVVYDTIFTKSEE
jgi:DNA repair exonuclease SbcCD ATPase subunit